MKLMSDGTLVVSVEDATKVTRVLVEDEQKNGCLYYADRPQGHWTKTDVATYRCSECGKIQIADDVNELNFCCCCGSRNKVRRLKGASDGNIHRALGSDG